NPTSAAPVFIDPWSPSEPLPQLATCGLRLASRGRECQPEQASGTTFASRKCGGRMGPAVSGRPKTPENRSELERDARAALDRELGGRREVWVHRDLAEDSEQIGERELDSAPERDAEVGALVLAVSSREDLGRDLGVEPAQGEDLHRR